MHCKIMLTLTGIWFNQMKESVKKSVNEFERIFLGNSKESYWGESKYLLIPCMCYKQEEMLFISLQPFAFCRPPLMWAIALATTTKQTLF